MNGWGVLADGNDGFDHMTVDADKPQAICNGMPLRLVTPGAVIAECKKCRKALEDPVIYCAARLGGYLEFDK